MQPHRRWLQMLVVQPILGALCGAAALADERPQLSLPLACEPHKTCFIQTYVDIDPGRGAKDYRCGTATYDQHSGVDFRLLSTAAAKKPFAVLASADGTVKAVRDGVEDRLFDKADAKTIGGRECGNGIIIAHAGGWETQYCHLRKGSLRVAKGQQVKRGDELGAAGFSGLAEFAQVHLTVRHDGKIVDPFLPDAGDGKCDTEARGPGLWEPSVAAAFPYRNGEIIGAGFAGEAPSATSLELDDQNVVPLTEAAQAAIVYGRFINLKKGDRVQFTASGPGGSLFEEIAAPLDRDKASYVTFVGKRRGKDPWPKGHYDGRVALVRDGAIIATTVVTFDLK